MVSLYTLQGVGPPLGGSPRLGGEGRMGGQAPRPWLEEPGVQHQGQQPSLLAYLQDQHLGQVHILTLPIMLTHTRESLEIRPHWDLSLPNTSSLGICNKEGG